MLCLRPDALRLPNRRLKMAPKRKWGKLQATVPATWRSKRPIIYLSCLEEFDWPKVGEFEVAIRVPAVVSAFANKLTFVVYK
jgi:hypothetical protein